MISNAWLTDVGGSELVSIELAEEYAQRGWEVMLYSPKVSKYLFESVDKRVTVTGKFPDLTCGWDIVWDHHGVLMPYLERTAGTTIVANHMSSYVEIEKPKYASGKPHRIFCNSEETRVSLPWEYKQRAELMQNPAPRMWSKNLTQGTHAMFISKHRPKELEALVDTFNCPSVTYNGDIRLTRAHFAWAKFVICNGKSVQYALTTGVPVFLYDHFGGPGWLTEDNFEKAAYYNFSGRGFEKDKSVLETIYLHDTVKPIRQERVNWRYRLHEWLYFKELV